MAVEGIFITVELEGDLGKRIHAHQLEFDPKMANYLPPHVTVIGSSGAGPIPADIPLAEMKAKVGAVAESMAPVAVRFGPPERFVQREIVSLPLDPHGPMRALHERLKSCGLPFMQARYPFTPHCTINLYPTLTPANLKRMLAIRESEEFLVHTLCVYHTKEPQKPKLLFRAALRGASK